MANFKQDLTTIPTAIANLTDDQSYLLQNLGDGAMGLSEEADNSPRNEIEEAALLIHNLEKIDVLKESGKSLYVWNNTGRGHVSIAEAPS